MKTYLYSLVGALSISLLGLMGCGGGTDENSLAGKQAKLKQLRTQQKEIATQIATLEKDIAKLDTSQAVKTLKPKLVAIDTLRATAFANYIDVMGKVDADQNTNISATLGGTVTKVFVKPGSRVSKGQTLATVDDGVMGKSMLQLEQQLAFATDLYNRQQRLWEQKIGSEVQYLQAKNGKEAIEKQIATLREQMGLARIRAPFAGVVDEVMLKEGQMAVPGYPAFRIVNNSGLKIKADIAESQVAKIKTGNRVRIFFPDLQKEMDATISYVSQVIDPMTRTFKAEIRLPNSKDFRPNMLAVVKIIDFSANNAMVIPVNTIQKAEEGNYVFVAKTEGDKLVARRTWVETGDTYKGQTYIKKGLSTGDVLITTGYQDLNEGDVLSL